MSLITIRHAQLFELLRQQNVCDQTRSRARAFPKGGPSHTDLDNLQMLAANSFSSPKKRLSQETLDAPDVILP